MTLKDGRSPFVAIEEKLDVRTIFRRDCRRGQDNLSP